MNKNDTTLRIKNEIHLYLDGELSENAKAEFEMRLLQNSELRAEFEQIRQLKSLVSQSHEPLTDDAFFTTRLMSTIAENKNKGFSKFNWFRSSTAFIALTGAVLFFFWLNPMFINKQIDEHKLSLVEFYSQNLRPLFEDKNLTTAQVFDFAFNNSIVLDNNTQHELHIDARDGNSSIIEVRLRDGSVETIKFEDFLERLEISSEGKDEIDSILNYYAPKIASSILVNDNNSIAVNSDLVSLQEAVRAEVYNVALAHNSRGLQVVMPHVPIIRDRHNIAQFVSQVKNTNSNKFLVFSPDTVFTMQLFIDADSLSKEIEKNWEEFESEPNKGAHKRKTFSFSFKAPGAGLHGQMGSGEMRIFTDSISYRVEMPPFPTNIVIPGMDSIQRQIDRAIVHMRRIPLPDSLPGRRRLSTYFEFGGSSSDSTMTFNFNMPQFGNIDSLMSEFGMRRGSFADSIFVNRRSQFDSSAVFFDFRTDSLKSGVFFDKEELREEMQEFQNEIRRFREEMMEMRKNLQPERGKSDSLKIKRKKITTQVEI